MAISQKSLLLKAFLEIIDEPKPAIAQEVLLAVHAIGMSHYRALLLRIEKNVAVAGATFASSKKSSKAFWGGFKAMEAFSDPAVPHMKHLSCPTRSCARSQK